MPSVYHPQLNDNNCISGQEYHHLSRVLRVKPDDVILLNDGKGSLAKAIVKEIDKKCVRFELLEESTYHEPVSPFAIAFSLLKNKHDELIVEKCTELGCTEFYPSSALTLCAKARTPPALNALPCLQLSSVTTPGCLV